MSAIPAPPSHRVGTGFFLDDEGRLLTSASIIHEATKFWIEWNRTQVPARLLGRDRLTNVAVLQVDPAACVGPNKLLPVLPIASNDTSRIGSMVVAIGFPYDLPSTPVVGFVTGCDIKVGNHTFITSHYRASCRLRPGQVGGPVLNVHGEVVGLAVAAHSDDQCYFLPIQAAQRVVRDIIATGKPQYGWVGLQVTERQLNPHLTTDQQWQVIVQEVYSNTPAITAGFRVGDVLLTIHTNQIRRTADVLNTMFYHRHGDRLSFAILRDGQPQEITLVVGQRPPDEIPSVAPLRPHVGLPPLVPVTLPTEKK